MQCPSGLGKQLPPLEQSLGPCAGGSCAHLLVPTTQMVTAVQPASIGSHREQWQLMLTLLLTCWLVLEFRCHCVPCRTGSEGARPRFSQLSGWWLTRQPKLWLAERQWCVLMRVISASMCEWAGQDHRAGACLTKPVHPQQGPISSYVCPQLPYDD